MVIISVSSLEFRIATSTSICTIASFPATATLASTSPSSVPSSFEDDERARTAGGARLLHGESELPQRICAEPTAGLTHASMPADARCIPYIAGLAEAVTVADGVFHDETSFVRTSGTISADIPLDDGGRITDAPYDWPAILPGSVGTYDEHGPCRQCRRPIDGSSFVFGHYGAQVTVHWPMSQCTACGTTFCRACGPINGPLADLSTDTGHWHCEECPAEICSSLVRRAGALDTFVTTHQHGLYFCLYCRRHLCVICEDYHDCRASSSSSADASPDPAAGSSVDPPRTATADDSSFARLKADPIPEDSSQPLYFESTSFMQNHLVIAATDAPSRGCIQCGMPSTTDCAFCGAHLCLQCLRVNAQTGAVALGHWHCPDCWRLPRTTGPNGPTLNRMSMWRATQCCTRCHRWVCLNCHSGRNPASTADMCMRCFSETASAMHLGTMHQPPSTVWVTTPVQQPPTDAQVETNTQDTVPPDAQSLLQTSLTSLRNIVSSSGDVLLPNGNPCRKSHPGRRG